MYTGILNLPEGTHIDACLLRACQRDHIVTWENELRAYTPSHSGREHRPTGKKRLLSPRHLKRASAEKSATSLIALLFSDPKGRLRGLNHQEGDLMAPKHLLLGRPFTALLYLLGVKNRTSIYVISAASAVRTEKGPPQCVSLETGLA